MFKASSPGSVPAVRVNKNGCQQRNEEQCRQTEFNTWFAHEAVPVDLAKWVVRRSAAKPSVPSGHEKPFPLLTLLAA